MAAHVKVINTGGGTCMLGKKGHRALLKGAGRTHKGAGRRALPFRASWSTSTVTFLVPNESCYTGVALYLVTKNNHHPVCMK